MAQNYSAQTSINIKASADKVWQALVDPSIVKKYLHNTTMNADWKEGGLITYKGQWKGQEYEDKGTVLKFEPKKLLCTTHWSPMSGTEDKQENYHVLTYELQEANGSTTLTLTQSNSPSQEYANNMIENGWKPILKTMKKIVEDS